MKESCSHFKIKIPNLYKSKMEAILRATENKQLNTNRVFKKPISESSYFNKCAILLKIYG